MARLTDEQIVQIKQSVSLLDIATEQGHQLKKEGNDFVLLCPFHPEKTPSCKITPSKNLFHCFGCGEGGSVIDWVQKTEKLSFRKACEKLLERIGQTVQLDHSFKEGILNPESSPAELMNSVVEFYHQTLKSSPEAQQYLESRGIYHTELIETFKLGFANRTLGYHLPSKGSNAGKALREQLKQLGILREKTGHEHFNGSIVVPILNEVDEVTEIYGRKVTRDTQLTKGTALHTYLPGPHVGIWNYQAFQSHREMILCESLIDAMTFWVHGFRNVTATYGTQGFTQELQQAFVHYPIEKIYIAFDRDEAGNRAAEQIATKLSELERVVYRVNFPHNMDANQYANQVKPAKEHLSEVLRKAEWLAGKEPLKLDNLPPTGEEVERSSSCASLHPLHTVHPEHNLIPLAAPVAQAASSEHEILLNFGEREYRIRGLEKNQSYDQLKINLLIKQDNYFHVDTLDLYSAKQRQVYLKQASIELGLNLDVLKPEIGQVLMHLEGLQDEHLQKSKAEQHATPIMSDDELDKAMALLQTPNLCDQLLQDFERCGVVGEHTNKLVAYLAATSRKLDKPLAIMVQSSSAAGKSSLMEAVLAMMPPEEKIQYSAMTGQSLFYMGESDLQHKILAIAEEEGAHNTSYALKLLQSEGEVTIASTGKNPATGNLETQEYRVEGPVMLFSTTTAIDIDEELMNRCLVLSVDESREQTEAIHNQQRKKRLASGLQTKTEKHQLLTLHQNAQRLLRPLAVVNPYAEHLTFLSDRTRTRRDHEKYLSLIDSITFLHQYQRDTKQLDVNGEIIEYIEATIDDIGIANQLANEVLGHSLDELPPQTRKLLNHITRLVKSACANLGVAQRDYHFTRKAVRAFTHWSDSQIKKHMLRLQDMEYLLVHQGKRGQSYVYELLFDGDDYDQGEFLMGLVDTKALYNAELNPLEVNKNPLPNNVDPQNANFTPQVSARNAQVRPPEHQKNSVIIEQNAISPESYEKRTTRGKTL